MPPPIPIINPLDYPFNVKRFGATGNGTTDDAAAIQRAVDAGGGAGPSAYSGSVAFLPSGDYLINSPIVLPRTGSDIDGAVHLVGEHWASSLIRAGPSFPANRALIEWSATTSRAWGQRIANLTLQCPQAAGTRAIWHKANQATVTEANCVQEWLQLELSNLRFIGYNDYQQDFIYLDIGCRHSKWTNLFGDPTEGTNQTYPTCLVRTRYQYTDGSDPSEATDSIGLTLVEVENAWSMIIKGGWSTLFEGRALRSRWDGSFSNGGRSGHNAVGFHFINSLGNSVSHHSGEGNADVQLKLTRSHYNDFDNFGVPTSRASDSAWQATHAYALGDRVVSVAQSGGLSVVTANLYFTCTTAGTSAGGEPTWPTSVSATVADGTVVWTASGAAVSDSLVLVASRANRFRNRYDGASSPIASFHGVKSINIDSSSTDNVFENYTLRVAAVTNLVDGTADAASECTLPTDDNRNYVSGHAVQSFNSVRIPYQLGSHPHRPSRTATLDFGSIASLGSATLTATVSGAVAGQQVVLTPPSNLNAGLIPTGWVSADNTITVRLFNATAGPIDPASGVWRITVVKP